MSEESYKHYLHHQGEKSRRRLAQNPNFLVEYDNWLKEDLIKRLPNGDGIAICLASRGGGEIRALRHLGWKAYGIDIQPVCKDNVTRGDFHQLPFKDECAAIVYTNSLDHSLKPREFLQEIKRVLSPTGVFILEVPNTQMSGEYEVLFWDNIEVVKQLVIEAGFEDLKDSPITFPYKGLQIIARKKL